MGGVGVSILLIAFFLNLIKVISQTGRIYTLLNAIGAALTCTSSVMIHYVPFVILEATWTLVSLVAFLYTFKKQP